VDVQLNSLHQNTGISKNCSSDASSLQTLEFGGDCWIYYGLDPFRFNKSINSIVCNYGQYILYQIGSPRVGVVVRLTVREFQLNYVRVSTHYLWVFR